MTGNVRKVVICGFDGLRPDRVTQELTPNLWRFANKGTWFRESRSIFPSMTRVATTSFATGSRPETHGIVNNAFFDRNLFSGHAFDTGDFGQISQAEAHYGGRLVEAPGLGCALARAGKSYAVVHTGSAGTSFFSNHKARENGQWTYSIHGPEATQTPEAYEDVAARFGPEPRTDTPKAAEIDYAAKVFIEHVLKERRPDVALLWFVEPDTAYHFCELTSDETIAITRRADERFGEILRAVEESPEADETLVIAMSDHGHLTVTEEFDLFDALSRAGFKAGRQVEDGVEVLGTPGVTAALSLTEPDPARLDALAETLMSFPQTGMLFSRTRDRETGVIEGTLPFSSVGVEHSRSPDLYWVARSSLESYKGLAGTGCFTGGIGIPLGGGMHGGLNPYETNTLLSFGGAPAPALGPIPDAADLTDIVPTVLDALGCPVPGEMTGHPLAAVIGEERTAPKHSTLVGARGDFSQELVSARSGERWIPQSGGRLP